MNKLVVVWLPLVVLLVACSAQISETGSGATAQDTSIDSELRKNRTRHQDTAGSGSAGSTSWTAGTTGSAGSGDAGTGTSFGVGGTTASGSAAAATGGVGGSAGSFGSAGSGAITAGAGATGGAGSGGVSGPVFATAGSSGDGSSAVAGSTGSAGGAAVPSTGSYTAYPALDLDDLAEQTDPTCVPASPDLPTTTRSITAATASELSAAMTQGSAAIRLTANIGAFSLPANTRDVEVIVPQGLRLGPLYFGNPGIARVRFRGPGEVVGGWVTDRSGATDIVFDGVRMTGQSAGGYLAMWDLRDMARVAWVNTVGRNGTTQTSGSVFLFAHMTDVVIANSNVTGSLSGTSDDWVLRSSESERILIVDSWLLSRFRHNPRQSGTTRCMVGITSPGYLDTPRRTKFINVTNYLGPSDQAAATTLDTDKMFYVDVDFVLDQPSNRAATVQFGGSGAPEYLSRRWVFSRVHWYVFDANVMNGQKLDAREALANAGEAWTYGGPSDPGPARFFYSTPNAVAVPPPPGIVSPLVGALPISDPRAL